VFKLLCVEGRLHAASRVAGGEDSLKEAKKIYVLEFCKVIDFGMRVRPLSCN
jgi:hypothetical protein